LAAALAVVAIIADEFVQPAFDDELDRGEKTTLAKAVDSRPETDEYRRIGRTLASLGGRDHGGVT
jgi:hypothetical protein